MAEEKKRGLFKRLFGHRDETAEAATTPLAEDEVSASNAPMTDTVGDGTTADEAPRPGEEKPSAETPSEAPVEGPAEDDAVDAAEADRADSAEDVPAKEIPPEESAVSLAEDLPGEEDRKPVDDDAVEAIEPKTPEADATPVAEGEPAGEEPPAKLSWFQRLRKGLGRSSSALTDGIGSIFRKRKLDDETLEELEDVLIQSDLGIATAMAITERLADGRYDKEISDEEVRRILAEEVEKVLAPVAEPLVVDRGHKPHVILLVGVNGTGKTTTIGKLAQKFRAEGRSVMLAAGDTFRAAAIEQLKIWGDRVGAPVISRDTGADAAGLVFDAMKEAKAAGTDILLIDTAGRLQNKAELMAELEKVVRVIKKHDETAPHSVLLTLDATTGQNALNQVEIFRDKAGVTGLAMTKLDGTARGGILVAIAEKHKLPVHFIGVGEGVDDLEPFDAGDFARAIAGIDH